MPHFCLWQMDLLRAGAVHVRAARSRFALQKCRPERPGAFRAKKMQAAARGSRKCLFYQRKTPAHSGATWRPTPPPCRQHKNVRFSKSIVKHEEKSYVWTRPEKSSGGEGLRPPPRRCSKHRALTKVRSADMTSIRR